MQTFQLLPASFPSANARFCPISPHCFAAALFAVMTRFFSPTRSFATIAALSCVVPLADLSAQTVHVSIDATQNRVPVSPYLYGKNEDLGSPQDPLTGADWVLLRDAGVTMVRAHGGNNGTKYNWQKKLSSHPDWYNNVYSHDWDFGQTTLQQHLPGVQAMWCFQLLGKVADNTAHNFDDWSYNQSQWWAGTSQNLAGGGTLNPSGSNKALKDGDPSLYLTDTSAVTSTAILDHWAGPSGLGLERTYFRYWNMDNEPEIWSGTHDDVMPTQLSAEAFMQRFFAYAKQARALYPDIKIVGPVTANEWQWYNWATPITVNGHTYPWLEYFIKRIGEEEASTGVRLLDVLDLHYYPAVTDSASILQLHRIFFDTSYANPEANGVHAVNGGWDTTITQEYIFARCQHWLDQYLGTGHGVTLGLTEVGLAVTNAPVGSVWYASTLGEFMKHGVEIFTPWTWQPGMWEVLHLYSRYNYGTSVLATSDDETSVSAYTTTDDNTGNLEIVLVNRALTASKSTSVTFANSSVPDGQYTSLQLSNLPSTETFVSDSHNALSSGSVTVAGKQFTLTLPPLSITSIRLTATSPTSVITAQPASQAAMVGGDVSFSISVFAPSTFQWSKDGTPLAGATAATLALTDVQLSDAGSYQCTVTTNGVVNTSNTATLTIYSPGDPALNRLTNISTRSFVGTGDAVQIAGFIISGTSPKTVLIRAGGPSLIPYHVDNVLANPQIELHDANGVIGANGDWSSDPTQAAAIESARITSGASAWPTGSKDAAMVKTLPPGGYTAIVSGVGGTTGVALIEVFEVGLQTSRLINISTRSEVGTQSAVQIAGFIISGSAPKRVLIRAGGPSLAAYSVTGFLANPQLELHDNTSVIGTNDDWGSHAAEVELARQQCGAPAWTSGSKDAAIVATLAPGGYTAIVSGVGNTTGIALIEVYELP